MIMTGDDFQRYAEKACLFLSKKEENFEMKKMNRTAWIKTVSFLSFLCVVLAASTIVFAVRANKYKSSALESSRRAVSELCENLDSITVNLQKSLFCNTEPMLTSLGTQLYKSAAAAKVGLGQITSETLQSDGIYKFLSQVGDYTLALDKKLSKNETLSESDRKALSALFEYSNSLSAGMDKLLAGTYDDTVSFEKSVSTLTLGSKDNAEYFSDGMSDTAQSLTDYPTLIYDGPFADSVLGREALFVKGKKQITQDEAKKKAALLLECRETELHSDSDETGTLELFCFSKGEKSVAITKNDGFLCYMTNPEHSLEIQLKEEQAAKRAKEFLSKAGYENMKESYYSTYDGVCTINFAYKENAVTFYADLIKVSVSLDSGKIAAVDARGFLMNHCERNLPAAKITLKAAQKKLSPLLSLRSSAVAVIPGKDGKERLCYELHCADKNGSQALIYIDAQTGEEADVLLLLFSDGGVLTR